MHITDDDMCNHFICSNQPIIAYLKCYPACDYAPMAIDDGLRVLARQSSLQRLEELQLDIKIFEITWSVGAIRRAGLFEARLDRQLNGTLIPANEVKVVDGGKLEDEYIPWLQIKHACTESVLMHARCKRSPWECRVHESLAWDRRMQIEAEH
jgi:hypothetical protein